MKKITKTRLFSARPDDFEKVRPSFLSHDEAWQYADSGGWYIPDFATDSEELYALYEELCIQLGEQ